MMNNDEKIYLFEQMPISKSVIKLAVPTILSSLVMIFYNLADTFFVGMTGDYTQNAAITLAAPVLLAFNAVNNLFGVGSSSMMSRALGSKNYDTVYRSSCLGFYMSLLCGIAFSLIYTVFSVPLLHMLGAMTDTIKPTADYLFWTVTCGAAPAILNVVLAYLVRAEGSALHASIGTMSGCVLNIILDPLFIHHRFLNMGAAGAGLATFISNCVACIYFFTYIFIKRNNTYVCINPALLSFKKHIVKGIFSVGVPASIQNLLNVTGMTILNNLASSYGSDAVAAIGITQKINMIPTYIVFGLSQGIMPLVSYNYASGDSKRMKKAVMFTGKISITFITAIAIFYYICPGMLTGLFIRNDAIIEYGTKLLRGFCLALPFLCMDFLAVGVFQACGFGIYSLIFALLRKCILEIPAIIILDRLFPLYGLSYAQFCAELILSVAAIIFLRKIFKKCENKPAL